MPVSSQVLVCIRDMVVLDRDGARLRRMFSPRELLQVKKLRFAKRRHEWMAGRVAAKAAAILHAGCGKECSALDSITLLADAHGRPEPDSSWPRGAGRPSISHSHDHAVSMVTEGACGIDLQWIEERILGLAERIINEREQQVLDLVTGQPPETGLTMLWSVKEAVKKMLLADRPGLFEAVRVEKIGRVDRFAWRVTCRLADSDQVQEVEALQLEQYMLAWCTEEGNNA